MDTQSMLTQAINAAKQGHRDEARRLLERILEQDERNEHAWLWLSGVVDDAEERTICLENVLTLNPENKAARHGLAALRAGALSGQPASPAHSPPEQPSLLKSESSATALKKSPEANLSTGRPSPNDRRVFIGITLALVILLLCIVFAIVVFFVYTTIA